MTDLEEKLTKENAKLSQEMNVLREQLEWFKREVFGSKKESLSKLGTPADSSSVIPGFGIFIRRDGRARRRKN